MKTKLAMLILLGCAACGQSRQAVSEATEKCISLYKDKRASSGSDVRAGKSWDKSGKTVIEIQERKAADDSSYNSSVCVVDFKEGSVELPSMFEQSRWEKD